MKKTDYEKLLFVELVIQVDEILRFGWWSKDGKSARYKDVFCIKNTYFIFVFDRQNQERMRTLQQIDEEKFLLEKKKMLAEKPYQSCENWSKKDGSYELKTYQRYTWKKRIPADNCSFLSQDGIDNPLKKTYDEVVKKAKEKPYVPTSTTSKSVRKIINNALNLSKELGIAYENIRAIGCDKDQLIRFKESYSQALEFVKTLSPADRFEIYVNIKPSSGRDARKQALKKLGIETFDADVKRLNLSELESLLRKIVKTYQKQATQRAIYKATTTDHDQREKLYERLLHANNEDKRNILNLLGIDVKAISFNSYSFAPIKSALAASIGIDLDKT